MPPKADDTAPATRGTSTIGKAFSSKSSPTRDRANGSTSPPVASPPAKKPRTSAAGARGVAHLTPEQLAKKRANDREAQRAIRERTRTQIETLERRIQELTSQQPYQELQQALRQKELVEAENADIKRRLQAVLGIIQPLLDSNTINALASPAIDEQRTTFTPSNLSHVFTPNGTVDHYSPSSTTTVGTAGNRQYSATWQTTMPPMSDPIGAVMSNNIGGVRQSRQGDPAPSILRTTSAERMALGLLPPSQPSASISPGPVASASGEVLSEGRRISLPSDSHITLGTPTTAQENCTSSSVGENNLHFSTVAGHHPRQARHPAAYAGNDSTLSYSELPPHTSVSCVLDGILLDFLTERRRLGAAGIPEAELAGPPYPDFTFFMLPSHIRKQRQATDPLSQMLTDVILTFPDIDANPEKVGTFFGMFLFLRWMVHPTQASYDRMLPFVRPTQWQLLKPHPVWIDCLPWPDMRNELVRDPARYPFDEFFVPFTKTVSVNWPYSSDAIFRNGPAPLPPLHRPHDPLPVLEITSLFEEHLRDLRSWSVGTPFAQTFPALVSPSVRVIDHPQA